MNHARRNGKKVTTRVSGDTVTFQFSEPPVVSRA